MTAVSVFGARKTMADWPGFLNGAFSTGVLGLIAGIVYRHYERKGDRDKAVIEQQAAAERAKIEQNVAWNTKLLEVNDSIRDELRERVAVLEDWRDQSAEQILRLETELAQSQRTVDKLMRENEELRKLNEELRTDNTRLVGELREERARNHEWKQKILALENLVSSLQQPERSQ